MHVIISYTKDDSKILRQLCSYLKVLKIDGVIAAWQVNQILPENKLYQQGDIYSHADILIPLLSRHYVTNNLLFNKKLKRALLNQMEKELIIVPVIVEACDWSDTLFHNFTVLPLNKKPLTNWENQDKAIDIIMQNFRMLLSERTKYKFTNKWVSSKILNILSLDHEKLKFSKNSFEIIKKYFKEYMQKISFLLNIKETTYLEDSFKFECIVYNINSFKQSRFHLRLIEDKLLFHSESLPIIQLRFYFEDNIDQFNKVFILSTEDFNLTWILHESFSRLTNDYRYKPKEIAKYILKEWLKKCSIL